MPRRALITAFVVLLGLSFWAWKLESNGPPSEATGERLFPKLVVDEIQQMVLGTDGAALSLRRGETSDPPEWLLDGPPSRPANDAVAEAAARATANLSIVRTLSATADPAHGLGRSALQVAIQLQSGNRLAFRVGARLPVSEGRYLQVDGQDSIHVVDEAGLFALERDRLDYHDLRVFPVAPAQVAELEITTAKEPVVSMIRSDKQQFMISARHDSRATFRADPHKVQDLLLDLGELRARRFADPSEEDGQTHTPSALVRVRSPDGKTTQLAFGSSDEQGDRFVSVSGELTPNILPGEVVLVRGAILDELLRSQDHYRDPRLLDITTGEVQELSWTIRGMEGQLHKQDQGWSLLSSGGRPVADELVQQILADLGGVATVRFVDDSHPEPETGVVAARIAGKKTDGSGFGVSLQRSPTHDYAATDDEGGLREVDERLAELTERLIRLESGKAGDP